MARTLGVEEEMILVDLHHGHPRPASGELLVHAARRANGLDDSGLTGAVEGEFKQQQIETHTAPVADLTSLTREVSRWRSEVAAAARLTGSGVAALATSPLPVQPVIAASPRYAWMEDRYQQTAREHLVCGCHVHVSVDGDEEGVGVLDRIRVWLPTLLALSANSPFWNGTDTGFASYRAQALARWPSWGPTDRFGSAEAYHRLVHDMVQSAVILDEKMVYFDARLAQRYPTVEIRTADVCFTVEEAVLVAALCRGLVETAAQEWSSGTEAPAVPTQLLRLAAWQSARDGLEGSLIDWRTGLPQPSWKVVDSLLEHVGPALQATGDLEVVQEGLARVRHEGNGAMRQRAVRARTGRLADVVADSVRQTALEVEPLRVEA
jgi:carboxylate-amine ligase